jgi:hypothetical protein
MPLRIIASRIDTRAGTILLTLQDPGDGFAPEFLADAVRYTQTSQTSRGSPGITLGGVERVDLGRGRAIP